MDKAVLAGRVFRATVIMAQATLLAVMCASPIRAQQAQEIQKTYVYFSIPAQPLSAALQQFAQQANQQVMFDDDTVARRSAPALSGSFSPRAALARLLAGLPIEVSAPRPGVFILKPAAVPLEPIGVFAPQARGSQTQGSGTYAAYATDLFKGTQSLREIPWSITTVTRQRMDDQNLQAFDEVLRETAGVSTWTNMDGEVRQLFMRGFEMSVLHGGLGGGEIADMGIYDRVEILRGPTALLKGAGNPGGVVNLVTKRPGAAFKAAGALSLGSWRQKQAEIDVTGALNTTQTVRARANLIARDREFFYDRGKQKGRTGYAVVEADVSQASTVSLSATLRRTDGTPFAGLPIYSTGALLGVPRSHSVSPSWVYYTRDSDAYALEVRHVFDLFNKAWEFRTAARHQQDWLDSMDVNHRSSVNPNTNTATYNLTSNRSRARTRSVDAYVSGPFTLFGLDGLQHHATLGYTAQRLDSDRGGNRSSANNINVFDPDSLSVLPLLAPVKAITRSLTTQSGLYGNVRLRLAEPLSILAGGRVSNYSARTRAVLPQLAAWVQGAKARHEFSPFGAVMWDAAHNTSVYASYSDIFIPNTAVDWMNRVLEPRVGAQVEVGAKAEFLDGKLNASVAAWRLREGNRPLNDPDPAHVCPTMASGLCAIASGKEKSRGVDVEVTGSPLPGWELYAGYSYATSTLRDTVDPRHQLRVWSVWRLNAHGPLAKWRAGVGVRARSRILDGVVAHGGGYAIWSAQIAWQIAPTWQGSLTVNNVFDRVYFAQINNLATRGYNYYGEPRNVMLTLRGSF